ncbi:serine/threonine protein kinase [Herbiconiux sp. CPCC 205716]|uniref:non-specific serine/threonine protein kinase n=1 Tax=Herbiconiux gentiana TaxID=2970912 RepID=A0ABT2GB23_9MICO|nr:serine/threonine-protein kinase [Herbiconiux gentiana]MCS5713398.1 serine/threonine protein kinase [Herbiconiux gentiana]
MPRRLPSPPPTLPGFTPVRVLGSGGFADVFLFEQNMPRRQVAVKVMLPEVVDEQVRRMFQVEADLMAGLSAHPSILTIYEAGVSSDGRPYLVMELCSSSLGRRYRQEPLPVAQVLRIGVKIAGALHTAHQQGVLHRDVKPSNILVTAYGAPVLSDFGIAQSTRGRSAAVDAVGLSVPWSAPEVVTEETRGTIASEVWGLSATLYSLLAGRSPFEVPGVTSPSSSELSARIVKAKPSPIGRSDVPASLERALLRGLSKRPGDRPGSALELLQELQTVETEFGLAQTGVEITRAEWAVEPERARSVAPPAAPADAPRRRRNGSRASSGAPDTGPAGPGAAVGTSTAGRSRAPGAGGSLASPRPRTSTSPRTGRRRTLIIALVATLAVVGGAVAAATTLLPGTTELPSVGEISAEVADGRILFSWSDAGLADGDSFQVETSTGENSVQRSTEFAVFPTGSTPVCITVSVVHAGRTGDASAEKCASLP